VITFKVRDYAAKAREMGRELFLAEYTGPFLVVDRSEAEESEEDFFTETIDVETLANLAAGPSLHLDPDADAYRIAKRKGANPFEGMITLGRARNCDIVIPLRKISKFHCFFSRGIVIPLRKISKFHCFFSRGDGESGVYTLADGGSRNGTVLNGERLAKNRPAAVVSGDRIALGDVVSFTFWSAEAFCDKYAP
jgi:hypothetical protein